MDVDWRIAITLEMVAPARHQEHLYNVNVMEMSSHKEPLKWLLFIG